jgi:hypothetical protein
MFAALVARPCYLHLIPITRNERRLLRQHRQHRLHGRGLFSGPSKIGLIASKRSTASTDDADGTDAVFNACAHPDHSRPCAAFTRECDLDAPRSGETPQSTGERSRIFAHPVPLETSARACSAHKRESSDALPVHMVRSIIRARTQVATGSASITLSMAAVRFAASRARTQQSAKKTASKRMGRSRDVTTVKLLLRQGRPMI